MRLRNFVTLSAAFVAVAIATACSTESPVAPQSTPSQVAPTNAPSASLLSTLLPGPTNVKPLLRKTALPANITVTKTIGILGGTLSIPAAGVTVVVPPLAVEKNTEFTMTARAGNQVAYDFAPHGVKFLVPLVMTQNLTTMQGGPALLGNLRVGYYPDGSNVTSVTELLSVSIDLLHTVGVTTIWHFSGYMFATGRSSDGDF